MSLFDKWISNLGISKSSSNQGPEQLVIKKSQRKPPTSNSSESDGDDRPPTPSHKSYPSTVSCASIRAPVLQPSQESRIVRSGPQDTRRRTLVHVPSERGSGDEDRDDLKSEPAIVNGKGGLYTGSKSFERLRLLADDRSSLQKTRSNGRFFQQGPLSVEQIRHLFWVEEIAPEDHCTQTARSLNLFRQRKRHCDVRLTTETGRLYAHKAVLVTFSQDLQNRLEASSLWKSGKMNVDLCNRGFENIAMDLVINWMYTGSIRCNIRDNFDRLLTVAEGLKISRLVKTCQKLNLSGASVPPIRPTASSESRFYSNSVQNNEHSRSAKSDTRPFTTVVESEEYVRWPVEKVIAFLSGDSIQAKSEVDVYKAAVRWLNHVKLSRIGHLDGLMKTVRWLHMPSQDIIECKHVDPVLFGEPAVSSKAALGQWQRDLLRRGIQVPSNSFPPNRRRQTTR